MGEGSLLEEDGEGVKWQGEEVEEKGRKEWETEGRVGRGRAWRRRPSPIHTHAHPLQLLGPHTHPGGGKGQSSRSSLLTQKRGHTLC